jgi:hypothetical protein
MGFTKNKVIGRLYRLGLTTAFSRRGRVISEARAFESPTEYACTETLHGLLEEGGDSVGRGCAFIEGDLRSGGHWCGADVKPGSAYCPAHHARCYIRPPAPTLDARLDDRALATAVGALRAQPPPRFVR